MSFRDTRTHLTHILEASLALADFLKGFNLEAYRADLKTRSAVERQLKNLTEAAFRLGSNAERLCPSVDWRGVRGLGNALRHEYDVIDDDVIWAASHDKLPSLQVAVQSALVNTQKGEADPA